jgi:hypothetical protein
MLAEITKSALPALRIAGALFLVINFLAGAYVFRNRRRLFGRDPQVESDIPAARHARAELILIPWLVLTTLLFVVWISLWFN